MLEEGLRAQAPNETSGFLAANSALRSCVTRFNEHMSLLQAGCDQGMDLQLKLSFIKSAHRLGCWSRWLS